MLPNGCVGLLYQTVPFGPQEELGNHRLPYWDREDTCVLRTGYSERRAHRGSGSQVTLCFHASGLLDESHPASVRSEHVLPHPPLLEGG